MKRPAITFIFLFTIFTSFAQQKYLERKTLDRLTDSIEAEGKALYRSEWASWYGTDIFMEKCADKKTRIGGYLSYETKAGMINIFFTNGDNPEVLGTIDFGNGFDPKKYALDTNSRKLTKLEKEYYDIRGAAIKRMGSDTIFKFYKNSSMNAVPIIKSGLKRVYSLTGPNENGVVLFGNDYLMNFNKNNEIISVKKLHNTLISIKSGKDEDSSKMMLSSFHSHLEGKDPFITATDICTMMLYHQFTTWNTMVVISKDYVSNWDCNKNRLVILTKEAWDKINKAKVTIGGDR